MFSSIVSRLTDYIKLKAKQIKLELIHHLAKLLGHLVVLGALVILGFFMMFFLSFALGNYLNEVLNSAFWGYMIVAGGYLVLIIVIGLLMRSGSIQKWIETIILKASEEIDDDE